MFSFNNFFNNADIKRFYVPTKFFFGKNSREMVFEICSNAKNILLLVTKSFSKSPLVNKLKKTYPSLTLLIVHGEPSMDTIDDLLKKTKDIDCIIAIGGGSVIDSAKAIYSKKVYGIYKQLGYGEHRYIEPKSKTKKITFIALPTTAGSGSEASRYYLISDKKTKEKTVSRSWLVCPEYAILDPYFLEKTPKRILILSSFDAFIHLFETFICKYEQSMFNDILILDGIPKILRVMEKILKDADLNNDDLMNLQFSAALAGISIANVRTGLIHDVGEALSAKSSLSHPETLFIFLETIMNFYDKNKFTKRALLLKRLKQENFKHISLKQIGLFWRKVFEKENLIDDLEKKLFSIKIEKEFVLNKVMEDKVLVTKESPVVLNRKNVSDIIDSSLKLFKIASH